LETDSLFLSAFRRREENIPHTRNNWVCHDFKERRIVPTACAVRTHGLGPGGHHLKSWLVETSVGGEDWRELAHEEDSERLNGEFFPGIFAAAGGEECRFIRLVNIGRNHGGYDQLVISAWEIFGGLVEQMADFTDVTSLPFLSAAFFGSFHRIPFPRFPPARRGQEGRHRRAEALVTHGHHRIPGGASPTEER
jgi:hypothetical protein